MISKTRSLILAAVASVFLLTPAIASAGNLYTFIVADKRDASIGETVVIDVNAMAKQIKEISDYTGLTVKPIFRDKVELDLGWLGVFTLTNDTFSTDWLNVYLDELPQCGPDDVVFFYYSGHGFRMDSMTTKWPALAMAGKGMELSAIHKALKARNPGLLLTFADCCNSFVPEGAIQLTPTNRNGVPRAVAQANYRKLFIETKGDFIASGCSIGEFSYCNTSKGGFFTNALLEELSSQVFSQNSPTWGSILNKSKTKVSGWAPKQNPQWQKNPSF